MPSNPLEREVLGWFGHRGDRHLTADNRAEAEPQRADAAKVGEVTIDAVAITGIDPNHLPE